MIQSPGLCEWAILPEDDYTDTDLPEGFHVEGEPRCPRSLSSDDLALTQPNGTEPCLLFDAQKCYQAYYEEKGCPVRRTKRQASLPW